MAGPGRRRRARARPWRRPACRVTAARSRVPALGLAPALKRRRPRRQPSSPPARRGTPGTAAAPAGAGVAGGRARLQDGDAHDAHAVVRQQLQADDGRAHECGRQAANVGCHGRQAQLQPQAALQVQVADQHRQLRRARAPGSAPAALFMNYTTSVTFNTSCGACQGRSARPGCGRAARTGLPCAAPHPRSSTWWVPAAAAAASPASSALTALFGASLARGGSTVPRPCTGLVGGARPKQVSPWWPHTHAAWSRLSCHRVLCICRRRAVMAMA